MKRLVRGNIVFETLAGLVFIAIGAGALALGTPVLESWFALKLLLFGLVFWIVLGIDTTFKPLTMILVMGPGGSTPEKEAAITRETHMTMAWALLLYVLIAAIAFMGTTKPF